LSFGSIAPQILELRGVENRIFPIQDTSLIQQCYATACTVIYLPALWGKMLRNRGKDNVIFSSMCCERTWPPCRSPLH